ncbi:MAG: ATP-binding cassette domain-containing protein, partial [Christensenellaceae bacterium]
VKVLDRVTFRVGREDKIAFVGENDLATTTIFKIVMGEMEPDEGTFKWGVSTTQSYFPKDSSAFFEGSDLTILDWMRQYSKDTTETYLRGFCGRMLFSGDDIFKKVEVLSGGEKVRCMLSRMMMFGSNVIILDQPTNHLDLESITAVNNGLIDYKGVVLFASHDHEFTQTIANRIIKFTPEGIIDKMGEYEDFIEFYGGQNIY